MSLNDLIEKYARLRDEIELLGSAGAPSEAKRARLMCELDQVDADLADYRRLARTAPMLLDEVTSDSILPSQRQPEYRSAA